VHCRVRRVGRIIKNHPQCVMVKKDFFVIYFPWPAEGIL